MFAFRAARAIDASELRPIGSLSLRNDRPRQGQAKQQEATKHRRDLQIHAIALERLTEHMRVGGKSGPLSVAASTATSRGGCRFPKRVTDPIIEAATIGRIVNASLRRILLK